MPAYKIIVLIAISIPIFVNSIALAITKEIVKKTKIKKQIMAQLPNI
uniref:Uncharacterized protein n=1 Tax=Rhizophora mucronata TaxID=61149 RepID=A0A2P2QGA7_RHIMU